MKQRFIFEHTDTVQPQEWLLPQGGVVVGDDLDRPGFRLPDEGHAASAQPDDVRHLVRCGKFRMNLADEAVQAAGGVVDL